MSNLENDTAAILRRKAWVPIIIGAGIIAFTWVIYLSAALFDKDFLHHDQAPDDSICRIYLIVAGAATLVGVPFIILGYRRTTELSRRGIATEARVVRIGGVSAPGSRPVTYQYSVGGKVYVATRDTLDSDAKTYTAATRVKVVYDPKNPGRCEVLGAIATSPAAGSASPPRQRGPITENPDLLAAASAGAKAGLIEGTLEKIEKGVLFFLFLAQAVAISGVLRAMDLTDSVIGLATVPICLAAATLVWGEWMLWLRFQDRRSPGADPLHRRLRRWHGIVLVVLAVATVGLGAWTIIDYRGDQERQRQRQAQDDLYHQQLHDAETGAAAFQKLKGH